jgi:hypothetical protein
MTPLSTKRPGTNHPHADAALVWPPVDDVASDPVVLDLERDRVTSIAQAAAELNGANQRDGKYFPTRARDVADFGDGATARPRGVTVPTRALVKGLAVLAIVQALAFAVVVYRVRDNTSLPFSTSGGRTGPGNASLPVAISGTPSRIVDNPAALASRAPATDAAPQTSAREDTTPQTQAQDGRLLVRSQPPGAFVIVDGRRRGTTPVTLEGLAPGPHRVEVQSGGAAINQQVSVENGATTSLVVPLSTSGWVEVRAPFDIQIFEDGQLLGRSSDGAVAIPAGTHRLDLHAESVGYHGTIEVGVSGGDITRIRPTIPDGVAQVNAQPWANVFVDGQPVGDTPLGNLRLSLGPHEIRFRHPQLGEQVRQVVVSADAPVRVSVDLRR